MVDMTNHTGHNHPATPAGRAWCRKLRLGDRPEMAVFNNDTTREGWLVTALDAQGRVLDLNGTPEGDVFQVWSAADAVWVVQNLRYGVYHDRDRETHTMHKVTRIELRPYGRTHGAEVHIIHADGTRTYSWVPRV
jgi:hypothetical protein